MDRKVTVVVMSIPPMVLNPEDVLILVDSVSDMAEHLEDEVERVEGILLKEPDNLSATMELSVLKSRLECASLTRGRLQPYLEEAEDFAVERALIAS